MLAQSNGVKSIAGPDIHNGIVLILKDSLHDTVEFFFVRAEQFWTECESGFRISKTKPRKWTAAHYAAGHREDNPAVLLVPLYPLQLAIARIKSVTKAMAQRSREQEFGESANRSRHQLTCSDLVNSASRQCTASR
jgi:hypothetical protein